MAASLPSPPVSRQNSPGLTDQEDSVVARLDELLEQYLGLLDQYTTLREDLSKSFSSGFFSLAQAQRTSTLGAGRRYGPDCYDGRMKAQKKVNLQAEHGRVNVSISINRRETPQTGREDNKPAESANVLSDDTTKTPRLEATPPLDEKNTRLKQDPATRDPLTWFGILAPPALRQTQHRFVDAVEESIPRLLSVESQMRAMEAEIWTCRNQLGIMDQYTYTVSEDTREMLEHDDQHEQTKSTQVQSKHTSTRKLAAGSIHARTPLLKLGE